MSQPKKHHFVPQFLLRGFLPETSDQLHVFDKASDRTWLSPTRDIAAERKYNVFTVNDSEVDLEPFMARMEDAVAPLVERIRSTRSIRWLTVANKRQLALFVAAQKLRTPAAKAQQEAVGDLIRNFIVRNGGNPEDMEGYRSLDEQGTKAFWGDFYITETPKVAVHIQTKDWFLFEPSPGRSFYISDAPVTLSNHVETPGRGNLGVSSLGIQIHIPISSNLTLAFFCRSLRKELERERKRILRRRRKGILDNKIEHALSEAALIERAYRTGRPITCKPENVDFLNSLQVSSSERFLYSSDGEFDLALEMVTTHPVNRTGRRPISG